jgi:hypothetical protein
MLLRSSGGNWRRGESARFDFTLHYVRLLHIAPFWHLHLLVVVRRIFQTHNTVLLQLRHDVDVAMAGNWCKVEGVKVTIGDRN